MELGLHVTQIIDRFYEKGYAAYAVGGCVRDLLRGAVPTDIDIAVSATPQEMKEVLFDYHLVETGIKHGTLTIVTEYGNIEATTFRTESEYSDFRHPDNVQFSLSVNEDLKRRDFTINAMAYNDKDGLIDLFGGQKDLKNGIIKCVGNAGERFNEDPLRILRALRFASTLDFSIESDTAKAANINKNKLLNISSERVANELNKLLCGKCNNVLTKYKEIIGVVIPELKPCFYFNQHSKYHNLDVYTHLVAATSFIEPVLHLRLVMLFHDIAKPACFTRLNGIGHFYGHQELSVTVAEGILKRLKYSKEITEKVLFLIKHHDHKMLNDEITIKRQLSNFGSEHFFDLLKVHIADNSAKSKSFLYRINEFYQIEERAKIILSTKCCLTLKELAVNGKDFGRLNYHSAEIGKALNFLLIAVITNKCGNNKEALLSYLAEKYTGQ